MRLILVRHAHSQANLKGLICGQKDSPLSLKGVEQLVRLKQYAGNNSGRFGRVYSSPLTRAKRTALSLTEKITYVETLKEIDVGDYSDITYPEAFKIEPKFKNLGASPDLRFPNGESYNMFVSRVSKFFEEYIDKSDDEVITVVAHNAVLNVLAKLFLRVNNSALYLFDFRNASISQFGFYPETNEYKLLSLNSGLD